MTGTLLNVAAVLVGTSVGVALGNRVPDRIRAIVFQGVGLVNLLLGMQMALQVQNMLVLLLSVVLGGALGEWLGLEAWLERPAAWAQRALAARSAPAGTDTTDRVRFVQGFVNSSLVFCVGPMTILGSIQDGLSGDFRLLAVKSLLDGITSIAFASALGVGVYLSAVTVLVVQGGLAGAALLAGASVTEPARNPAVLEMTAVGGVLILGMGLRLLQVKAVPVGNYLPALALAPLLTLLLGPTLGRLTTGL